MGLGVLDDHNLEHVPGTAVVLEGEQRREVERKAVEGGLRYDKTGQVLLVPQPSDDPNDPLNWPLWKRDMIICILSLAAVIASTLSSILAANSVQLALFFGHSFTDVALLTGYHLLGVGVAGFLFVPSAVIWGKRHVYLLGTIIIVISCAWGGSAGKNYASFLWARIFQGVGLAPYEALVNASVGDLYHVHQRGARMAVSNFFVFGGAFFTPVLAGKIAHEMGHEWPLYFVAIFAGCMLPLIFFFCPETAYKREEKFDIDTMGNLVTKTGLELASVPKSNNHSSDSKSTSDETARDSSSPLNADHRPANPDRPVPRKATFVESLALFTGRKSDQHYLHLLLRPFSLFLHPGILWACLIQGVLIGFTVLIGVVLASILLGPPLWFGEVKTGYMYSGAFIGAILGFALMGLVADPSARLLTRWNRGVYEPEFRIILVIPQLILGGAGLYGFGWTSNDTAKYGWFWPDFFFALVVMGMVCGATASALYIVDAHRDMSIEAFTCLLVFKNFFSFALTFKGFDWISAAGRKAGGDGVKDVFIAVGSVQVAICALSIPMYILGKKNRSYFHRHNVFFKVTDAVADVLTLRKMRSAKKPGVVVG